jgi:predicted GNAT family acetyltransferase
MSDHTHDGVCDNAEEHRFELMVEGQRAEAYYEFAGKVITFTHTDVPLVLSGRGVGSRLIKGALDAARARGLKVRATCPFVSAYLGKHKEYGDIIA